MSSDDALTRSEGVEISQHRLEEIRARLRGGYECPHCHRVMPQEHVGLWAEGQARRGARRRENTSIAAKRSRRGASKSSSLRRRCSERHWRSTPWSPGGRPPDIAGFGSWRPFQKEHSNRSYLCVEASDRAMRTRNGGRSPCSRRDLAQREVIAPK
jgi:hypothetical protein